MEPVKRVFLSLLCWFSVIIKVSLTCSGYHHLIPVPRTEFLSPEITDDILARRKGAPSRRYQVCPVAHVRPKDLVQTQTVVDGEDINGW
jgi:hypothetical protein